MSKVENLEALHFLANTYGGRPSQFMGLEDEWAAYQLDMVTMMVGKRAEARLWQEMQAGRHKKPVKIATDADLMMLGIGVNHV